KCHHNNDADDCRAGNQTYPEHFFPLVEVSYPAARKEHSRLWHKLVNSKNFGVISCGYSFSFVNFASAKASSTTANKAWL
ncbi:MAG: hypothetical protein OEZ09_13545, partial [Betaproteobacteria bacterium]|nr:hypothetical protein [Betaproteobacteria bacterium]